MKRKMNYFEEEDKLIAAKLKWAYGRSTKSEDRFHCKLYEVLSNLPANEPKRSVLHRFCTWIGIRFV